MDGVDGVVRLWSFTGNGGGAEGWKEEFELAAPVLVDQDSSLRQAYFVPNGGDAFAMNPRHYIIDAEGTLVYMGFNAGVAPEIELIQQLLGG